MDDIQKYIDENYLRVKTVPEVPFIPGMRTIGGSRAYTGELKAHIDRRGWLMEVHRSRWFDLPEEDDQVRQVYLSATQPETIKGWHLHRIQTDRFVCLRGRVTLALCDPAEQGRPVHELTLDGQRDARVVVVPPGIAHGWVALGDTEAIMINCCSHEYNGTDEYRISPFLPPFPDTLPHDWFRSRHG